MKSAFLKSFLAMLAMATMFAFVGCEENEEGGSGNLAIEVSTDNLAFTQAEESKTVDIATEAKWESEIPASASSWVTVTPKAGKGNKTVTISVAANTTGSARTADLKFWTLHPEYGQWEGKRVTVSQSASDVEIEELEQFFYDNFDKAEGPTSRPEAGWPYFDQTNSTYANPTGSGAATVTYESKSVSIRANSTSNGSHSLYEGSGGNNLFFGSGSYVIVKDVTLPAGKDCFVLTFGTEMYNMDEPDLAFPLDKFHVYVSGDNAKWTELTYAFEEGDNIVGKWNDAKASFKLTSVPEKLSVKFVADLASVYRLDDVALYSGGEGAQVVDLSQGGAGTGGSGSDTPGQPSTPAEGVFFADNFDKATGLSQKPASGWPYLDTTGDTYVNPTGDGAATVTYESKGVSVRGNSSSNNNYSDYAGSGNNNLFFGADAHVSIQDITLPSGKDTFFLTFGAEKYTQSGDSTFKYEEFHVYLSGDNTNWVEIDYAFASGDNLSGRWNDATATFKITNVPEKLSIKFSADAASVYRLDDVALGVADSASQEVTLGEGGGSTGGQEPGGSDEPTGAEVTVTEAISAAKDSAVKVKESTVVAVSAKSYLLTDGTSYILAYKGDDPGLAVGDKVTVTGTIGAYRSVPQIASPVATKTGHDDSFTHPEATVMDGAAIDAYAAMAAGTTYIKYVKVEGELVKDGNYWNLKVEGASKGQGSISYPTAAMCPDSYSGKKVTVYGYTIYQTRDTDVNIIATQVVVDGEGGGDQGGDEPGGDDSGDDVVSDADVVVNFADASVYPSGFPVAKANILVDRNEYVFGDYTLAFAGSTGAGYYQVAPTGTYTDCYVIFGKKGAYVEFPAIDGKSLSKVVATARQGTSANVMVGVCDTDGVNVDGGTPIKWEQTAPYKYTYSLSNTSAGEAYRLYVNSEHNAQLTLLELYYVDGDNSGSTGGDDSGDDSGDQGGDDSGDDSGNQGGDDSGEQTGITSVADFKALPDNENDADKTLYTLKGTITSVENTEYGNFWLMDDTGSVLIYGLNSPEGEAKYWAASGAKVGDDIVVKTIRSQYGNSPQGKNALFVELVSPGTRAFWSPDLAAVTLAAAGDSKTVKLNAYNINGDVIVTSNNAAISATYANDVVTISAGANNGDVINATVTVSYGKLSHTISVTQLKQSTGGDDVQSVTVEKTIAEFGLAYQANVVGTEFSLDDNISVTFAKGSANNDPAHYYGAIRLYQNGATMTVTASNGKIIKAINITFTDTKGDGSGVMQNFLGAEDGTFTVNGATGAWTGEAGSVKFTTTGTDKNSRAYVSAIEVIYE